MLHDRRTNTVTQGHSYTVTQLHSYWHGMWQHPVILRLMSQQWPIGWLSSLAKFPAFGNPKCSSWRMFCFQISVAKTTVSMLHVQRLLLPPPAPVPPTTLIVFPWMASMRSLQSLRLTHCTPVTSCTNVPAFLTNPLSVTLLSPNPSSPPLTRTQ